MLNYEGMDNNFNMSQASACVIGISGYSGSGKTTLIVKVLSELKRQGLYVGVLKHTVHHGLNLDLAGKDTDRFYKAGADFVSAHDIYQGFARFSQRDAGLGDMLKRFPCGLDLILVEGYKDSDIPKIWLESGTGTSYRKLTDRPAYDTILNRNAPGHVEKLLEYIYAKLRDFHAKRFLRAGLLVGGKSVRMGRAKALLEFMGETLARRSFDTLSRVAANTVLLGSSEIPEPLSSCVRLPDAPGINGPMAGMLSAFRWDPDSAWIISAVDMPLMDKDAWDWLLSQRRYGVWAVLPRISADARAEMTGACYEPMIFEYVESLSRKGVFSLQEIAGHPKVATPVIPQSLAHAWKNVNTQEEWKEVIGTDSARRKKKGT